MSFEIIAQRTDKPVFSKIPKEGLMPDGINFSFKCRVSQAIFKSDRMLSMLFVYVLTYHPEDLLENYSVTVPYEYTIGGNNSKLRNSLLDDEFLYTLSAQSAMVHDHLHGILKYYMEQTHKQTFTGDQIPDKIKWVKDIIVRAISTRPAGT